jgi:hypothetical protein
LASGEVFDEQGCMSRVWLACGTDACGTDPCFGMAARCADAQAYIEKYLGELVTGCTTGGVATCDDSNPCTVDRCLPCRSPDCTGLACANDPIADGAVCGATNDSCRVSVCRAGTCREENAADDTSCEDPEDNPCTADVCRSGTCEHPIRDELLGKPCGSSPCSRCVVTSEKVVCEAGCPADCICNPQYGCFQASGTLRCD